MSELHDAIRDRRSHSKVTEVAPGHDEVLRLVALAGRVADHGSLRPWRLIELRGSARNRLGQAIVQAVAATGDRAASLAAKPLRAPLLIAIVAHHEKSDKVADWEQDAVAAGVAHLLSLLLSDAGWGVMWRTGEYTRSEAVAAMHDLEPNERLLGWLYVGGIPEREPRGPRKGIDAERFVTALDEG